MVFYLVLATAASGVVLMSGFALWYHGVDPEAPRLFSACSGLYVGVLLGLWIGYRHGARPAPEPGA